MSTDQPREESTAPIDPTEVIDIAAPDTEAFDTAAPDTEAFDTTPNPTLPFAVPPTDDPVQTPPAAAGAYAAAAATTAVAGAEPEPAARRERPSLRVGTVVWGLVLAVIGAGVIAVAAGARFDLELALIGLLVLSGVGLLAGSIVTSSRRRHR